MDDAMTVVTVRSQLRNTAFTCRLYPLCMPVFVVRVVLSDRPGALGAVASRIGAVRGDVVGVEIVERGDGKAVDEFVVELADPAQVSLLVSEVEEVDGVFVEAVAPVAEDRRDGRLASYEAAVTLMAEQAPEGVLAVLTRLARQELDATWAAVVEAGEPKDDQSAAIFCDGRAPAGRWVSAYVADVSAARRQSAPDVAAAKMAAWDLALVVGRPGRRFAELEQRRLQALADVADARWREVSRSRSAGVHPSRSEEPAQAANACNSGAG